MSIATTILHAHTTAPGAVERALEQVFAAQSHPRATRLEGTFSAVLAKATDIDLAANYRYLICRPHPDSAWTPILELGVRTVGLEARLSRALGGAAVFTTFVYGDGVSGYRLAREGAEVDRYASNPTYLLDLATIPRNAAEGRVSLAQPNPERERGRPTLFADLLPAGTTSDEFARVVLAPGWWEQYDAAAPLRAQAAAEAADTDDDDDDDDGADDDDDDDDDDTDFSDDGHTDATSKSNDAEADDDDDDDDDDDEEVIDESDRMRCIALALELWGPDEYPFAQELEEIANKQVGPATLLGFV